MNKTILGFDERISIIILSAVGMLFTFIGGYGAINSLVSFLFILIKCVVFVVIPLALYVLEKNNMEFKKVAGIYTSYFIINLVMTVIASISMINGSIAYIWKYLFDLVSLITLLSCLFILIEQVLEYAEIRSKVYKNTIMKIVYLVGNFISYPFLNYINKKSENKN